MRKHPVSETVLIGKNGLLREGIAGILRAAGFRILASVSSADYLVHSTDRFNHALFLVIHTENDFDVALDQIKHFRGDYPQARIAIVSNRYRIDELAFSFQAGANAYFVEVMDHNVFIKSLELVLLGETIVPAAHLSFEPTPEGSLSTKASQVSGEAATALVPDGASAPHLSSRENLILQCLIGGDSNKRIARSIGIAEATVKVHVKAIFRKIRVTNRTQAAIWGLNNKFLIRPSDDVAAPPVADSERPILRIVERSLGAAQLQQMMSAGTIKQANHAEMPRLEHLVPEHRQIVVTK